MWSSSLSGIGQLIHRVMALANAIDDDLKGSFDESTRRMPAAQAAEDQFELPRRP
jgi:hypothetical protein